MIGKKESYFWRLAEKCRQLEVKHFDEDKSMQQHDLTKVEASSTNGSKSRKYRKKSLDRREFSNLSLAF